MKRFFQIFMLFLFVSNHIAYGQQDIAFHKTNTFLKGKNVIKLKRDLTDSYLWILTSKNEIYRINSLTQVIDDYSSAFNKYEKLKFIDIAGRSMDTLYVATEGNSVLAYTKNKITIIGTNEGIHGNINSIAIDAAGKNNGFITKSNILLIATDKGMCRYDIEKEIILPVPAIAYSTIYEATYRNEMLSDSEFGKHINNDTLRFLPAFALIENTIYGGNLWLSNQTFGQTIRTAFFTRGSAKGTTDFDKYANLFWGTEKGLFQNSWKHSHQLGAPFKQYLSGDTITKITSIYGALNPGNGKKTIVKKENLLVGTSKGLYYSNSEYRNYDDGALGNYTFNYYEDIGKKMINDICVNVTFYGKDMFCEDAVWIASEDGLYLLKPDYSSSIKVNINAIKFDGKKASDTEIKICPEQKVKIVKSNSVYNGFETCWYKNGQPLSNVSPENLTIDSIGDYYAVLFDPCNGIHIETNHLIVDSVSTPIISFNYPDEIKYRSGDTAFLQTNLDNQYRYRWYQNDTLTSNSTNRLSVSLPGTYKVEVAACPCKWLSSKKVKVIFTDSIRTDLFITNIANIKDKVVLAISDSSVKKTASAVFLRIYPNPFYDGTTVSFTINNNESRVSLNVYDIKGIKIKNLYTGSAEANISYSFSYNDAYLSSGIYVFVLTTSTGNTVSKAVRVK